MTTSTTSPTIIPGCIVYVRKGCKAFGITKGTTLEVTEVRPLGADYSHQVRVSFKVRVGRGFYGQYTFSLNARHINRLSDPFTRFHNGDPTENIEIEFLKAPAVVQ